MVFSHDRLHFQAQPRYASLSDAAEVRVTFRRSRGTRHFQTQPRYASLSFLFPSFFDLDLARSFSSLSYSSYVLDPSLFSLVFIPLPLIFILAALGFIMALVTLIIPQISHTHYLIRCAHYDWCHIHYSSSHLHSIFTRRQASQ